MRSITRLGPVAATLLFVLIAAAGARIGRSAAALDAPGNQTLRELADQFTEAEMRLYPEQATRWGDHRYDGGVSDLTQAGIDARIAHALEWKRRFDRINPASLSAHQEADREWLIANCDGELLGDQQIRAYERDPGFYMPTSGVYRLIERNFAPAPERMRSVTARENAALTNLAAARANLKPASVARVSIDIVIQQMTATIAFFKNDVPVAFADVPDGADRKAFAVANQNTITALSEYQKWMKESLAPKASGSFAIGAEAYRRMLVDDDMVDIPLAQLEAAGEQELKRLQGQFRETARQIDPNRTPAEVMKALAAKHPVRADVIPHIGAGLKGLRQYVIDHRLASIPSDVMPTVAETPPFRRATTFASMDSPGPLEKSTEAYFYVTLPDPSWPAERQNQLLEFYSAPNISDVSTHEVFPGHYVQFLNNRLNPDKVRLLYYSGANVEGWGLYVEQMMLDEGLHSGEPTYRLAQIQMALQRACRYLAGIRMHTHGMTVEDAAKFFESDAYMTPHNAMVEALRGTGDPGYLRYQLGKLMILKLREDVRAKQVASFDLGKFHDAFLAQGAVPIRLIRRAMLGSDGPLL